MTHLPENLNLCPLLHSTSRGRQTQILIAVYMKTLQQLKYVTWLNPQSVPRQ